MPGDAALRNDPFASKLDNVPDYELSEKTSHLLSESSKQNTEVCSLMYVELALVWITRPMH